MTAEQQSTSRAEQLRRLRAETVDRLKAVVVPEVIVGALIVVFWSIVATIDALPPALMLLALIVGIALHVAAVDSGNFIVLGAATGFVLLLIIGSARSLLAAADPLVFTLAGASALAHNELIRLSYARRRSAVVDSSSRVASAVGLGLVTLLAVIAIGVSEPLAATIENRSWLWMPVAAAVVGLVLAGFAIVPTVGAPEASKERWQPGDQLPPARFEADPAKGASSEVIDLP